MALLRLETNPVLLWATPLGERVPFEVSREVTRPLQPLCETSPYCPDERVTQIRGEQLDLNDRIVSTLHFIQNPHFKGVQDCPYGFINKQQCYSDLGRAILRQALFAPTEASWVSNYLSSLGYNVQQESITQHDIENGRTLLAHGVTYNFHEVRFELGPRGIQLVMVRNPHDLDNSTICR